MATIFVAPLSQRPASDDELSIYKIKATHQLQIYKEWEAAGYIRLITTVADLECNDMPPLPISLMIENPDCIGGPDELGSWRRAGVACLGLAWNYETRFAGGTRSDAGITPLGHDMVRAAAELGILIDVSHLNDRSTRELLERHAKCVIASHSNSRTVLGHGPFAPRHLCDAVITEIGARGGVIGSNLFNHALVPDGVATVADVANHMDHIASLCGGAHAIGLGSDMDGGRSAAGLCRPITSHHNLSHLTDELTRRGWTQEDIEQVSCKNWLRVLREEIYASSPS